MKAFAYLRVSGKGQVDGYGFDRQREAIEDYAERNGIEIERWFREEGVSGTVEGDDRPAMGEMVDQMRSTGIKAFVVERLDRLARDLMVQEAAIADFQKAGFEIISTEEPDLCSSDPSRVLMRQLMGAISQYEKSQIVLKLRKSRAAKKAATGRCEGQKPYGWYESEKATVSEIRNLRNSGLNPTQIAEILNMGDWPTRKGGKWHPYVVGQILKANGVAA